MPTELDDVTLNKAAIIERSIATGGWRSLVRYLEELGVRIQPVE